MKFTWNKVKAKSNDARHGVRFEVAKDVFKDPFAIEFSDDREDYGEERFIIIGMVQDRLLLVVYAMRDDVIRIISARAAEPCERRKYHEENSQDDQA